MKKLILLVVLITTTLMQDALAQGNASQNMQDVITAYINVKNALTKDNGDSVRLNAKKLYTAINNVPMEKLSASEHTLWMQYMDKLSYDAEHIKSTNDIEHQREHFVKLSSNFWGMLNAMKINTVDIYYQYCPMANDGKGAYWVSEKENIVNPYMGNKMPSCGSTKQTLKAKR